MVSWVLSLSFPLIFISCPFCICCLLLHLHLHLLLLKVLEHLLQLLGDGGVLLGDGGAAGEQLLVDGGAADGHQILPHMKQLLLHLLHLLQLMLSLLHQL